MKTYLLGFILIVFLFFTAKYVVQAETERQDRIAKQHNKCLLDGNDAVSCFSETMRKL